MVKTPETLTATQRAAQLNLGRHGSPPKADHAVAPSDKPKKSSYAEIAKKSLLGTPPPLNAMGTMSTTDIVDGSVSNLAIGDIERYEYDPRIRPNPRYAEIKASIRASGILNHISVTKRPGSARYTVYGGGNTRLRIARELYDEGDQRFARLTVIVKVWKGDASTIAAHLVENEQRGEISFWEKAQGVLSFKANFEKERGDALSASDLNRELKAAGLNYGLRMLQNFMFAAEHLAPIGPWLKAREVNEAIRPTLAAVTDMALRLGRAHDAEQAMQGVLHQYAARLSSTAPAETVVAEDGHENGLDGGGVDAQELVREITAAVAHALEMSAEKLAAMVRAVETNPRIAMDTLLLVDAALAAPQPDSADAPSKPGGQGDQLQLGRMLSAVRTPAQPAPAKAPLGAATPQAGAMPPLPPTRPGTAQADASGHAEASSFTEDLQPLFSTLGDIQNLVDLSDVIFTVDQPNLMFGMYLDLPKGGIASVDGIPLPEDMLPYRTALWKLLVSLTGQLDRRCSVALPLEPDGEPNLWRQLFDQGEAAFHHTANELLGEPFESVELSSLTILFSHPELGYLVTRLLSQMEQIRVQHPERQLEGFVPLFVPREAP